MALSGPSEDGEGEGEQARQLARLTSAPPFFSLKSAYCIWALAADASRTLVTVNSYTDFVPHGPAGAGVGAGGVTEAACAMARSIFPEMELSEEPLL